MIGETDRHLPNARTRRALDANIQAIQSECGGMLNIHVIDSDAAMDLIEDTLAGSPEAAMLMTALIDAVAAIDNAPANRPMLCGCCPNPLRDTGYRVGLALPHLDLPEKAIAFGICVECATKGASLEAKAVECLRKIWPDGRLIQFSEHQAGNA